jgi:hypothetical protein
MPKARALLLVLAAVAAEAGAQDNVKWLIGVGPTVVSRRGWLPLRENQFEVTADDTLIRGAATGRGIATLGVTRGLANTALNVRFDATYSLATSANGGSESWLARTRAALREETIGFQGGLEWNAIPSSAWSPYITTSVGTAHTRLRWNTDPAAAEPNRSTHSNAVTANFGFGLRAKILGRSAFVESRRQWLSNDRGSSVLPLTFGVRLF